MQNIYRILFLMSFTTSISHAFELDDIRVLRRGVWPAIFDIGDSLVEVGLEGVSFAMSDTFGNQSRLVHLDVSQSFTRSFSIPLGDGWFDTFVNRQRGDTNWRKFIYRFHVNDTTYIAGRSRNIQLHSRYKIVDAKPIAGGDYLIVYRIGNGSDSSPHWAARITSDGDTLWTREIWDDYDPENYHKIITGIIPDTQAEGVFYFFGRYLDSDPDRIRAGLAPLNYVHVGSIDTSGQVLWTRTYVWGVVWEDIYDQVLNMHGFSDGTYAIIGTRDRFYAKMMHISADGDSLASFSYSYAGHYGASHYADTKSIIINDKILILAQLDDIDYFGQEEDMLSLLYINEDGDSLDGMLLDPEIVSNAFSGPMLVRPDGKVMLWVQASAEIQRELRRYTDLLITFYPDGRPGAVEEPVNLYPNAFFLSAYPNPFNSMLTISFMTGRNAYPPRLGIYDINGREVADLVDKRGRMSYAGEGKITPPTPPAIAWGDSQTLVWDASAVPAGVYFVRLQAGSQATSKKVVLMR